MHLLLKFNAGGAVKALNIGFPSHWNPSLKRRIQLLLTSPLPWSFLRSLIRLAGQANYEGESEGLFPTGKWYFKD